MSALKVWIDEVWNWLEEVKFWGCFGRIMEEEEKGEDCRLLETIWGRVECV